MVDMEIGNLVIQILKVIVWPLSVVMIVLILRPYLGQAILAISRLKYKELEVEFRKNLEEAQQKAEELKLPSPEQARISPESTSQLLPYDRLVKIATMSSRAAIVEAWLIVETALKEVARAQGINTRTFGQEMEIVHDLIEKKKLPEGTLDLFKNLHMMRNDAAHAHGFEIEADTAVQYVNLALSLALGLRLLIDK
jgi:hypothetical protein